MLHLQKMHFHRDRSNLHFNHFTNHFAKNVNVVLFEYQNSSIKILKNIKCIKPSRKVHMTKRRVKMIPLNEEIIKKIMTNIKRCFAIKANTIVINYF